MTEIPEFAALLEEIRWIGFKTSLSGISNALLRTACRLAPPNTATANICYRRKFRPFGSRWLPQTTSVG